MDELGLLPADVLPWFNQERNGHFILVGMEATDAQGLAKAIDAAVRRCYLTDDALEARARETGRSKSEILAAKLPDPGPTMSGDFGEILVYLYHASREHPTLGSPTAGAPTRANLQSRIRRPASRVPGALRHRRPL